MGWVVIIIFFEKIDFFKNQVCVVAVNRSNRNFCLNLRPSSFINDDLYQAFMLNKEKDWSKKEYEIDFKKMILTGILHYCKTNNNANKYTIKEKEENEKFNAFLIFQK